jgi:hypothetical protein
MKTTTAFRALEAGRKDRSDAERPWVIRSVNKDGSVSKAQPMARCSNEFLANVKVAYLEKVNPGCRFVVRNEGGV